MPEPNPQADDVTDRADDADADDQQPDDTQDKNWLEWSVTAVGAALVLFVVGFLVYELVAGAHGPADLSVSLGEPTTDSLTVEVPVEIYNAGARVAEAAVVEVCAGPEACAQIAFDYVPYDSRLAGTVGLEAPLRAPLTSRVVSYRDP